MIAIFTSIGAWFTARLAAWGIGGALSLAFLGPLGPILTGVFSAIGSLLSAIFEIIASLSKSAEGRAVLAIAACGLGFLYLRFHYIEEGKAESRAKMAAIERSCTARLSDRHRR